MGLLSALGLKPSKAMLRQAAVEAAKASPTRAEDIAAAKPSSVGAPLARSGYDPKQSFDAGNRPDAQRLTAAEREQADKLLPRLGEQRHELAARAKQLAEGQRKIVKLIAAAPAAQKKPLEESKKKIDAALAETNARLTQVIEDIEAIDDPHTKREELVRILGRGGSKAKLGKVTEVEVAHGAKGDPPNVVRRTATTTSFDDGVGVVSKREESARVGPDGVTAKKSVETERVWDKGSVKTGEETQVKAGPGGVSVGKARTLDATFDGEQLQLEETSSLEAGKDGVKFSEGVKSTEADGSSREQKKDLGIERGDGKLGVAKGKATTTTDADGKALTHGAKGGGGLVAGKDGMGGYGKGEAEIGTQRKEGFQTGAVAGLHGNVTCDIGDPKGDPPRYPVTLRVSLGAEITLKSGIAKKDQPDKAGIAIQLGAEVTLDRTLNLTAGELAGYVQALKTASAGGKVAATHRELAIIQAGVTQGWDVAQLMWKGGGKPLSREMVAQLRAAGDSVALGGKTTKGGKVSGSVRAVSVEFGAEETDEHSTTATRNEDGDLDIAADASDTTSVKGKVGVSMGLVGGSVGKSQTFRTSFGYEITVDAKKDADGAALAALGRLAGSGTEAQYEAFIAQYKGRITVKGRKKGKAVADSDTVGMSVGGVEASIGLDSGTAEQVKTDGDGRLVEAVTVGTEGSGGGVKLGDLVLGDSKTDEAVARRTGDGDATLELRTTKKATSLEKVGKLLKSKLPFVSDDDETAGEGRDGKKKSGLLTAAAGGGEDEDTQWADKFGIKLSRNDLARIGQLANAESTWTKAAIRKEEYFEWKDVAKRIRNAGGDPGVVAHELAKFVGGDKIHRLEVLNRLIRPSGSVAVGKAFEFPESLKNRQADYEKLIERACEDDVRQAAKAEGAAKAGELGRKLFDQVEALRQAWTSAKDFSREGTRSEMLSAIARRKTALTEAMREVAGRNSEADRRQAALEAFGRLNRECYGYRVRQDELFEKVRQLIGKRPFIAMVDRGDAEPHMKALSQLYAVWKRDLDEAIALAKANDIPERRWQENQPNRAEWERLKKACMMSGL